MTITGNTVGTYGGGGMYCYHLSSCLGFRCRYADGVAKFYHSIITNNIGATATVYVIAGMMTMASMRRDL